MSFSNYFENEILDNIFGNTYFYAPWISVGLSRSNPGEGGYGLNEPSSGAGYERVLTYSGDWEWSWLGEVVNSSEFVFPVATGYWGTITHFALFDEDNYGVMIMYGALGTPREIPSGYQAIFDILDLSVTLA